MNNLCFEQAFTEQCRLYLKLAELFADIRESLHNPCDSTCQRGLESVLHISHLLDRPDFKSKLLKELNRLCLMFQRLRQSNKVNQAKLDGILAQLENLQEAFRFTEGKLGQSLRDNDFLTSIRLHLNNPGGACSTELPAYHLWLMQPVDERQKDLHSYFQELASVHQTVSVLLDLMRDSALYSSKIAERGFYQMSLDAGQSLQLLRIELPRQTRFFPETSVGRHGISIRFYPLSTHGKRQAQTETDIVFKLSICVL